MGSLAAALVALSQGIVFFHAGDEILCSKSLNRDSYRSGAAFPARLLSDQICSSCRPCIRRCWRRFGRGGRAERELGWDA